MSVRIALLASAEALHSRRWAHALAERGFEVELMSLEPPPPSWQPPPGVRLRRLPALRLPMALRYPLALRPLRRALAEFRPQLVDAHFVPNYGLLGALAARHPLVVNCWGSDLLIGRDPFRAARARYVLEHADLVFVDAENLAARVRTLGAGDRLRVEPWGIDLARFPYSESAATRAAHRTAWPPEWGSTPDDGPAVVSTRVLHSLYDVETLVRAWPSVVSQLPGARLWIAGDGPERARLETRARALALDTSVRFLGRLEHETLPRLLGGGDVYVSTSRSDSTSLSLLEAMASGCYPVVSDIEGNREWVSAETASLFAPGDAGALAERLKAALGGGVPLDAARAHNRATVEARGDWARTMDRVASTYRALAGG